jgi:hypothetical protein
METFFNWPGKLLAAGILAVNRNAAASRFKRFGIAKMPPIAKLQRVIDRTLPGRMLDAVGNPVKGLVAADQKVRSAAIELPHDENFVEGARHGLFAEPKTDPISV